MQKSKKFEKYPCRLKANISFEQYFVTEHFQFTNNSERKQSLYVYFDTLQRDLFKQGVRVRVRIRNGMYSFEVKRKTSDERTETSHAISLKEFQNLLQGIFPEGQVKSLLAHYDILFPLQWIETAVTIRQKRFLREGILVLDQTYFNSIKCFQIEFRTQFPVSLESLDRVKRDLGIVKVERKSKLQEMLDQYLKKEAM